MTASARDVAAALRERLPGLPVKKLHKLLYYCQGHHLAHTGHPLFSETISAWDMGPVVGELWRMEKYPWTYPTGDLFAPPADLTEGQLNTIGYVVSRYGDRYGWELESQSHGEMPWMRANANRPPRGDVPIETDWILEHFKTVTEAERQEDIQFEPTEHAGIITAAIERQKELADRPVGPDEFPELLRRRAELAARMASAS